MESQETTKRKHDLTETASRTCSQVREQYLQGLTTTYEYADACEFAWLECVIALKREDEK